MDVRIGIAQSVKELEVEVADDTDRQSVMDEVERALGNPEGVLWLSDRRGRRICVPVGRVAYVEFGAPISERRVGFGIPASP